jgi:glycosyltransferase involved in cell wall biosynthesis
MSPVGKHRIAWLTNVPSGDQMDLLKELSLRPEVDLTVIYCSSRSVKGRVDPKEPFGRGLAMTGMRLPGPGGGVFLNPSIVTHLWKKRYDLVFIAGYIHPTMQLAMLVRALQRRPWVLFAERPGMNSHSSWRRVLRTFSMLMLQTADAVIGTGRLAQQQYQERLGEGLSVFSLPYLVDLEPFLSIERAIKRQPNGISFLSCGELIPRKGTDVLIRAFSKAAQSCPHIRLEIVGDGPEKSRLQEQIPESLKNRIRFEGKVPFAARTGPFARSDVFIHPARHDGWGVVIQEALSAGLPVIATRQTGAAYDLLEPGKNGFLIEADDENELSQRILWFAQHQSEIPGLGASARNGAKRLTPAWGAAEIVRIATSVLEKRTSHKR